MTEVDFTIAVAVAPARSPRSATASLVMIAVSRTGSLTTSSTCASRPSVFTSVTTPRNRFRALRCDAPASPRSRSISLAGTTRRLLLSRSTVILPALSQRRRVSRLIPRTRAASLAVYTSRAMCVSALVDVERVGGLVDGQAGGEGLTDRTAEPLPGQRPEMLGLVGGDLRERTLQRVRLNAFDGAEVGTERDHLDVQPELSDGRRRRERPSRIREVDVVGSCGPLQGLGEDRGERQV